MINNYINTALETAEYKILDDGTWFGSVPKLPGVWANNTSVELTRRELIEVIDEWIYLKLKVRDDLPNRLK